MGETNRSEALSFTALSDPVIESVGVPVDSLYVETFWLPVIGPSTLFLLRHVARGIAAYGGTYVVEADALGVSLGLSGWLTKNSPLLRSINRAVTFRCAEPRGERAWAFRTHLDRVTSRRVARLPDVLRERHAIITRADARFDSVEEDRREFESRLP